MTTKTSGITKEEWRLLGFFYEFEDSSKTWNLTGSPTGLQSLVAMISDFCSNPMNSGISEHIHVGPYQYLKVVAWNSAEIRSDGIYGTIDDLRNFSAILGAILQDKNVNKTFEIGKTYCPLSENGIQVFIKPYGYDPAVPDHQLWVDETESQMKTLESAEDLENLMKLYGGFHDSCLVKVDITTGYKVDTE